MKKFRPEIRGLDYYETGVTNGDSHDHSGGDGAQIDHGGLAGLTDDDHTQYIYTTPGSSARNVIQPSGDYKGLILKYNAGQSTDIFQVTDENDVEQLCFESNGDMNMYGHQIHNMACDNGTAFPAYNATGQWFYRTDIKTLFQYDGTKWQAMQSYGAVTLYVDGTLGSDAVGKGYSSGAGATATIQYAIDLIPPIYGGNVTINATGVTYTESLTFEGKQPSGAYYIYLVGTMSETVADTTADIFSWSTIGDSTKAWTVNAYAGKRVRITSGTGAEQMAIIQSNTATTLTIAGSWSFSDESLVATTASQPDATSHFVIEDWSTVLAIGSNNHFIKMRNVYWKDVKVTGTTYVYPHNIFLARGCWFASVGGAPLNNRNVYIEQATGYLYQNYITSSTFAGVQGIDGASVHLISPYVHNHTGASKGVRITVSGGKIYGGTIENCATGVLAERNGVVTFQAQGSDTTRNIEFVSNTTGVYADTGGQTVNTTNVNLITYTGCTTDYNADAASFGKIN